jgi:microcystin-dependent protein
MSGRTTAYLVAPNGSENEPEGELPAGVITQYAGVTAPAGWLFCNGVNYLPEDYPALFRAIGQNFGAGTTNNQALGAIQVSGGYTYTGTSFSTASFFTQVNFHVNTGCIVRCSGSNPTSGSNIDGLRIRITSAPNIGTTGGTFVGTFLDVPATASGSGSAVSPGFMDMLRVSFQVPDTTGVTIRGAQGGDSPFNIGERDGNDNVNITPQMLPSHAHGTPGWNGQGYVSFSSSGGGSGGTGNIVDNRGSQVRTDAIVYTSAGAVATASGANGVVLPVTNPYVTISSIIKT